LRLTDSLELKVSPAFLLLSQNLEGTFNRYDAIVRYMAIEELQGANNTGLRLYHKMQRARNRYLISKGIKIKPEDTNKDGTLMTLVESFSRHGFNAKYPLTVNPQLGLVDGSHRLACALYYNVESILVEKSGSMKVDYGFDWFSRYFEPEELLLIQQQYREILKSIDINAVLNEVLSSEKQVFGRGGFYQSFEKLGLPGQRPTTERYKIYKLDQHLTPDQRVLDIGCNCGFFTLMAAENVRSAVGVEITHTLVQIAQMTQVYLGKTNIQFRLGNFNKMEFEEQFDFIFSFAVHHWLDADMKNYGKRLHGLLNAQGKVLLESQNIHKEDHDWQEKLNRFCQAGFKEIQVGRLMDDGVIERRFSVLQKTE